MPTITALTAQEILDSRGMPTLEVTLTTKNTRASCAVPAGASTGTHEALELRDGDPARFGGKGVQKAVAFVGGEIAHALVGKTFDQASLDGTLIALDGTPNKARLGANTLLGVSLAFARAAAGEQGVPLYAYFGSLAGSESSSFALPRPMCNVLNGGKHADNALSFQEFMLVPKRMDSVALCVEQLSRIIAKLKQNLQDKGFATSVGDEGGFAPHLASNKEALDFLYSAIQSAGLLDEFAIGLDAAASSFYKDGRYTLEPGLVLERDALIAYYEDLCLQYPILSIEDGFAEDAWEGFQLLTQNIGGTVLVVGDDLLVTSQARIAEAGERHAVTAAIIKPNQVGTITETITAVAEVRKQGWVAIASHRSGETSDTAIADLAVGLSCAYGKFGALARGERVCKYNRLMEIERELLSQK